MCIRDSFGLLRRLLGRRLGSSGRLGRGLGRRRCAAAQKHHDEHKDVYKRQDARRVGLGQRAGELAERLAHQASLKTDRSIADFSLDLGTRGQRGDGVDDDGIDRCV